MRAIFKLEEFCCCCNLKTGSLVIGTLGWLLTLFQLFYLTSPLKQESNRYKNTQTDIAAEISYSVITLIVCILMIYGVFWNHRRLILPWLMLKCMECIAWTVITILVFVLFFFVEGIIVMIFLFFILFFVTTLNWYFWVCIWSLYIDLTDKGVITEQSMVLEKIASKENVAYCPIDAV